MENILEYNNWEDKLWALYNSIFKDASYTITDGVIFPDKYASTPFKVMIMNREAYDEDHSSYSLNQDGIAKEIGEGIIPFKKQKTLRCRLRQYLSLIHLLSKKGFNEVSEKEVIDFVNQSDNDDLVYYLSDAAYINIKKSDGKKRSVRSDLKEYAKKGIDVLKEQIRFCNPSVILGGDVCYNIIDNLFDWGEELYGGDGYNPVKIYELVIDGKSYPFIDMFHPSRTQNYKDGDEKESMSMYFLELFKAMISVEKTRPGYWSSHMNNKCFEASALK
ncbi:MAG: hypothetical protein SPF20_03785 [Prevotella sp.]|nr:hypothetical protein [Prevotella sp.]